MQGSSGKAWWGGQSWARSSGRRGALGPPAPELPTGRGSGAPDPELPSGRGFEVPSGCKSRCTFVPEISPLRVEGISALMILLTVPL